MEIRCADVPFIPLRRANPTTDRKRTSCASTMSASLVYMHIQPISTAVCTRVLLVLLYPDSRCHVILTAVYCNPSTLRECFFHSTLGNPARGARAGHRARLGPWR
eukprot:COSAG06_NODE_3624_length_5103_cov_6.425260_2_plen_105_part_00